MKSLIVLCVVLLGLALAEKPAPYPPKGWKPQGARLELPSRAYGVPRNPSEIEFTTLTNEYIPPATVAPRGNDDDFLQVQGLPDERAASEFQNYQPRPAPSRARIVMAPAPAFGSQPFLLSPAFAPQFAPQNQQLREQKFGQQRNPKNDAQQIPPQEYGPPAAPNQEYGPPTTPPQDIEREEPENSQPEEPQNYPNDESDDSESPVVAVANADARGNLAATQQGQFGQYYILLPDNSLQKVRFATGQTDDDRQLNGFSAQLR